MSKNSSQRYHFRPYSPNQTILFPQRIDKDIAEDDPVRLISHIVEHLDLSPLRKLYKERGRSPYDPKMLLKVVIYAYMNNIYSCRKIEKALKRDIHFIWLAGYEQPDFITVNRFRNRVKNEINNVFTQLVLLLCAKGLVTLDVEYIDGTKIESKANKYTFVWRKTVERNRAKLMEKIRVLLSQVDDAIAQDRAAADEPVSFTPETLTEIADELFPEFPPEERYPLMERCMERENRYLQENPCRIGYPGVAQTIRALAEKHRLFIVSNSQQGYPELCISKLGLNDCFRGHLCFGDTNRCKGETLKILMEQHGITSCAYIGDTQGDMEAAYMAGMPFIWAAYGFGTPEKFDIRIEDIRELQEL